MASEFRTMTALVVDHQLFPFAATKLAEEFGEVLYWAPTTHDAFPVSRKMLWGDLPNVRRIKDWEDHIGDCDLIVCPDIGFGPLQVFLRARGFRVWGSALAEVLETDRSGLKRLMLAKKMLRPPTWMMTGMDDLRTHLEKVACEDTCYVKASSWRGDLETFCHKTWQLTEPWYRELDHKLGPMRDRIDFVVEGHIEGVEVGYDGICIDGKFPEIGIVGYEEKDVAYCGHVMPYHKLPPVLREVNTDLAPVLAEMGCRSMFSTEVRVTEDGDGYLIDPCMRFGSPPSEAMLEVFSNWPEIFYGGADGQLVKPEPVAKYCAELVLRSPVAEDDFLALQFPEEHRRFIKLHGHAVVDDTDYVVALGMDIIGAAVGIGDTLDDAKAQAIEVAKSIVGYQVTFEESGFDELDEKIEQGVRAGVTWE